MMPDAVIFDMDGLLIDSEPLWSEAGREILQRFGKQLTAEQYESSTGLRTREWLEHWFDFFAIDPGHLELAEREIVFSVIDKIRHRGKIMPGVFHIVEYFGQKQIPMALATSSPMSVADVVLEKLGIRHVLRTVTSAEHLPYGKPHPLVYLNCAEELGVAPPRCLCFEDSFNGLIAAKAAKMKCVVVPDAAARNHPKWGAADMKISSLQNFNDLLLMQL